METRSSIKFLFFIKRSKLLKDATAPLFLRITVNKKISELSLHSSVDPDFWNSKNGCLDGKTKEANTKNKFIDSVKFKLQCIINDLYAKNLDITSNLIKQKFLGISNSITLIPIFEKHNKYIESLIRIDFAEGILKQYKTTMSHLKN